MVGIVVVSHSSTLAEGVRELALGMAQTSGAAVEAAGGLDEPGRPLGTDANLVAGAIERADSGDGVIVLMDLGSAVMSAEMAAEMLEPELAARVRLCAAPLVEGAVAAVAIAGTGEPLDTVEREALRGLAGKQSHLGPAPAEEDSGKDPEAAAAEPGSDDGDVLELTLTNALGLHARPAARFVSVAGGFKASVTVMNLSAGKGPANARSLISLATLGAGRGHTIAVRATGPQATEALAALRKLAEGNFGDET